MKNSFQSYFCHFRGRLPNSLFLPLIWYRSCLRFAVGKTKEMKKKWWSKRSAKSDLVSEQKKTIFQKCPNTCKSDIETAFNVGDTSALHRRISAALSFSLRASKFATIARQRSFGIPNFFIHGLWWVAGRFYTFCLWFMLIGQVFGGFLLAPIFSD